MASFLPEIFAGEFFHKVVIHFCQRNLKPIAHLIRFVTPKTTFY